LIDEIALLDGLTSGVITSAALDVFEDEPLKQSHPILAHDRCILGSHNASNTIDAVIRASDEAISLLHGMLKKES
jgi:D-3-phosphoglycerate dehydrogenase